WPPPTNEFFGLLTLQPRSMSRPSPLRTFHFARSMPPPSNSSFHTIVQSSDGAGGAVVVAGGFEVAGAVVVGLAGAEVGALVGAGAVVGGGSTVDGAAGSAP